MENRIGTPIAGIVSYQELKVGQRVYSVGAPKGLELSLGEGLISQLRGGEEFDFIQTTAPVSHGSSGGGLFDKEGRLIGITTFILADGQSLNFAIPADWIFELAPRHAEAEQKRTEERRRVDEAKREDYRKQRAAAAERERQQQEIAHKQRDAEETKRRAEAAARVAEVRNESPRLPESPNVDYPVPPGSFVLGGVEFSEASGRVLVTRISARAKTTLRVGDQLVSCPTFHSVGSISDLRGCGPMERVDDKSEKKQFVFFITRDGMETPKSVIVDKKQAAWPR